MDIGDLGGGFSRAISISDNGEFVIGVAELANGDLHAFKHSDIMGMIDLGTLGGRQSTATSISEDGDTIVGYSTRIDGKVHSFRYTDKKGFEAL